MAEQDCFTEPRDQRLVDTEEDIPMTREDKIIRSGNETWRGAKDASDTAKKPAPEGGSSAGKTDTTTVDGEDATKRDASSRGRPAAPGASERG